MSSWGSIFVDLSIIVLLVMGIAQFRNPRGARSGNATAATALLLAFALVLYRNAILDPVLLAVALLIGGAIGAVIAMRVTMIQIPAMVALPARRRRHGRLLISVVEVWRGSATGLALFRWVAGLVGMIVGAATFSGSHVAAGKLSGLIRGSSPACCPGTRC